MIGKFEITSVAVMIDENGDVTATFKAEPKSKYACKETVKAVKQAFEQGNSSISRL